MCDPVSIGVAISAGASIAQGLSQASALNQQAQATERQSELVGKQGEFKAQQVSKQNENTLSTIEASFSSAGIKPSDVVLRESAEQLELDVEAIKFGTEINQSNLQTQAGIQRGQAGAAALGGFFNAASTIVGSPLGRTGLRSLTPNRNPVAFG